MNTPLSTESSTRRQFLTKGIAAGTSLCFGCSYLLSFARAQNAEQDTTFQSKVSKSSEMSYEQVFKFAFGDILAPQLIAVARQIGREKFIEMLKSASDEAWFRSDVRNHFFNNVPKQFWSNVLDVEVLENSEKLRIYKISKCLWAKTFREADAADIGYAMWCYGDYALARTENKKLERETTLMQGHDCCLLKWTKEA